MFWTAIALIMTVLMGGIIAYNGDLIGRKYGKRRVSLFNLRPKHTAILITSITGVFISGVTTGAMFLLVRPVREVILEGESAIRELKLRKTDISRLSKLSTTLDVQVKAGQEKAEIALSEKQSAETSLATTRSALAAKRSALASAQSAKQAAESRTHSLRMEREALLKDKENVAKNVAQLRHEQTRLQTANTELQRQNQEMSASNLQIGRDNLVLTRDKSRLESDIAQMSKQLANHREENNQLAYENNQLKSDNSKLQNQNKDLNQRKTELEQKKAELEAAGVGLLTDINDLYKRFEALRTRRIAIHGGEDLARITIPARTLPETLLKTINQLKQEANKAALAKGARPSDQSSPNAIQVVDKQFVYESPFGSIRSGVSESERINALVHKLSLIDSPVCLLAIAVANSADNEPAAIDFQPFNDWLVYPKGRVIATHKVSGRDGPDKLFPNIMSFLKDLGQSAIQRGIIPRIDPMTGNPEVGSLNWTQLVNLVDRVRRHPGDVQITAVAKDDTKASNPLNLDFEIKASL